MIIWLASYPRSGNTFFRVILNSVYGIHTYSIYNDADIGSDQKTINVVGHSILPENFDLDHARKSEKTYYIKTHEHYDKRVNPYDKVIYLIRDGRESTLSYMKHQNIYGNQNKTLLDVIYGNTWFKSWGNHIKSWEKFPRENILYIHFEELTDKPLDQINKISNFLKITAVNNKIPTFDELKTINPKFFRSGKKDSWKDTYTEEEHIAFWYKHFESMKKYGYLDSIPEIFNNSEFNSFYKAIKTDNLYNKNEIVNEYEKKIKPLKSTIEKHRKELSIQTKKSEVIEKKLNSIIAKLARLTNIKLLENPIQKYKAYKELVKTYYEQR